MKDLETKFLEMEKNRDEPLCHKVGVCITQSDKDEIEKILSSDDCGIKNFSKWIRFCLYFKKRGSLRIDMLGKELRKANEELINLKKEGEGVSIRVQYDDTEKKDLEKTIESYRTNLVSHIDTELAEQLVRGYNSSESIDRVIKWIEKSGLGWLGYIRYALVYLPTIETDLKKLVKREDELSSELRATTEVGIIELLHKNNNASKLLEHLGETMKESISQYNQERGNNALDYIKHAVLQYAYIYNKNQRVTKENWALRKRVRYLELPFYKKVGIKIRRFFTFSSKKEDTDNKS